MCKDLVLIELFKLKKSKSFLFGVLTISVFPLLMAIVIAADSYVGIANQSVLTWIVTQLYNANVLYIAPTFFIITCSNFLAKEIDDRSIEPYISMMNSRKEIYKAKVISLTIFATIVFLVVIIMLIAMYYILVNRNAKVASGLLFEDKYVIEQTIALAVLFLYNSIIIPSIATSLGVFFKPLPTISIFVAVIVISQYLHLFAGVVKYISPWSYVVELVEPIRASANQPFANHSLAVSYLFLTLFITVFFGTVSYKLGVKRFSSRDL